MTTRRTWLACGCAGLWALGAARAQTAGPPPPLQAMAVAPDVWFVQAEAGLGTAGMRTFIPNAGFSLTGDCSVGLYSLGC